MFLIEIVDFSPNHENYWGESYGRIRSHDLINKGEMMNFDKIFMHPRYKFGNDFDDFDMSILKFREPIQLFWHIRTLCVPQFRKKIKFAN